MPDDAPIDGATLRRLICRFAIENGSVTRDDAYDLEGRGDRLGHAAAGRALRDLARDGYLASSGKDVWEPTGKTAAYAPVDTSNAPPSASPAAVVMSERTNDDPINGGGQFGPHRKSPAAESADERVKRILAEADRLEAAGMLDDETRELIRQARAAHAEDWQLKIPALFPRMATADFAPHHAELWDWVWAIQPGIAPRPMSAFWPRGHAKCRAVTEEVLMADGTRRPLGAIRSGDRVLAYDERSSKMIDATVTAVYRSGVKRCLRVTTRSGKVATVTAEHRMLTFDGWVEAGQLTVGDRLASPRHTPVEPSATAPDWEVALAAYVIAEGSTTGGQVRVTNADPVLQEDIVSVARAGGFDPKHDGRMTYRLNGAQEWARRHGLMGKRATEKRVPQWVFRLPEGQRWRFLAVMFDTDGFVSKRAGQFAITLANRALIEDLLYLCASVGMPASVHERPNECAGAWQLTIDQEALPLAAERMPLLLKRDRLIDLLRTDRYSLIDSYPPSVGKALPRGLNRRLRRAGVRAGRPSDVTRRTLRRMITVEPHAPWVALEAAPVWWDAIVSVEDAGLVETADIEVRGPENFIGGLLVTHNSAIAEMACVCVGHRRARKYALYVSGKQAKADDHVQSIADLLESPEVAQIDPELCERRVGMYGQSKGWRHNRLTTQAGFTVDAVGLDSDVRGARLGDHRPDLIIFDDIDAITDTPLAVEKKITRITHDLIPAGSQDVAILFVQNVIHNQSIAARLAEVEGAPEAKFLTTRTISGPVPAIEDFEFAERDDPEIGRLRTFITGGRPTWAGYGLDACQRMIDDEGIVSFLSECQHVQGTLKGGMFDHIDFDARRATEAEMPQLAPVDAPVGYDQGLWPGACSTWCDPAVTSTDRSDSCAVTVGGIAPDGKMWCLYSWEQIASPEEAMRVAIEVSMRWGAQVCGFETDQGGDTWEVVYRKVVADLLADPDSYTSIRHRHGVPIPRYAYQKAGGTEGNLSKRQRVQQLVARYDIDAFRHLVSGAAVLEAGLGRFPKYKPFDIVDSWWHNWRWMSGQRGGEQNQRSYQARNPARKAGALPDVRP